MVELVAYKRMPVWTKETVPTEITHKHNTKIGTWGKIKVLTGEIRYEAISDDNEITAVHHYRATDDIPMVKPQAWHRVSLMTDDTSFFVEFFCTPEDYLAKKYGFTATHSEVIAALETITESCKVLDLGCGQGRNALYLAQKGFDVTAVDQDLPSLETLLAIMEAEDLALQVGQYDINQANLTQEYDWIISTVVLMFLERDRIPAIIENMQAQTKSGGYHLIVAAMSTEDAPCPVNFSFTFGQDELRNYYKDWDLVKYNEDFGQLHRRDENGHFLRLRFATLLARKP